jgi:hypothetical protein
MMTVLKTEPEGRALFRLGARRARARRCRGAVRNTVGRLLRRVSGRRGVFSAGDKGVMKVDFKLARCSNDFEWQSCDSFHRDSPRLIKQQGREHLRSRKELRHAPVVPSLCPRGLPNTLLRLSRPRSEKVGNSASFPEVDGLDEGNLQDPESNLDLAEAPMARTLR